jgi:hypothetical protein
MASWARFAYVALVVDVYARYAVDCQVSRTAHLSFVLDALKQAVRDRRPIHREGLVQYSDRGRNTSVSAIPKIWPKQHRAASRQRLGQLRQGLGREHQRSVKGRGYPLTQALADHRGRGVRRPQMC